MESKKFLKFFSYCKFTDNIYDYKVLSTFKKDFYKNFIKNDIFNFKPEL